MTQKDFELIAATVRERERRASKLDELAAAAGDGKPGHYPRSSAVRLLAHDLATALASTNPRFDRARFLAACGVEG